MKRANGDRFVCMALSRGNAGNLENMQEAWLGAQPSIGPMLKFRGLTATPVAK